jgi:hypothetical protein
MPVKCNDREIIMFNTFVIILNGLLVGYYYIFAENIHEATFWLVMLVGTLIITEIRVRDKP